MSAHSQLPGYKLLGGSTWGCGPRLQVLGGQYRHGEGWYIPEARYDEAVQIRDEDNRRATAGRRNRKKPGVLFQPPNTER